jgi:hypothetical protein
MRKMAARGRRWDLGFAGLALGIKRGGGKWSHGVDVDSDRSFMLLSCS